MPMLTEAQAKAILDKVVALSTADECTATLSGSTAGNIRFALNNVSTSGIVDNTELAVQVAFGKRVGTASINEFDDAALERVVRRAEDLARLAPENPEFMPAIGKQDYRSSATWDDATAAITPEYRAQVAADSIVPSRADKLIAAGFLEDSRGFTAFANSNGNFGYQTSTSADYTCTVRTEDGTGSGWVGRNVTGIGGFDERALLGKVAAALDASRGMGKEETRPVEPGVTVQTLSFERLVQALSTDHQLYIMDRKGAPIREQAFEGNPCFLLTDHIPMPKKALPGLERMGAKKITLGRTMLFASQCVVLIHHELDQR